MGLLDAGTSDFLLGPEVLTTDCFTADLLVHSGCSNKILQTEWLIHKHLFLTALEARSQRSRCQDGGVRACSLPVSSHDGRGEGSF